MPTNYQKSPAGLLLTLSFMGIVCVMAIAVLVLDVDLAGMLDDQVTGMVQSEVKSKVQQASTNPGALKEADKALYEKAMRFFEEWRKRH